jgi:hypothetical protein
MAANSPLNVVQSLDSNTPSVSSPLSFVSTMYAGDAIVTIPCLVVQSLIENVLDPPNTNAATVICILC